MAQSTCLCRVEDLLWDVRQQEVQDVSSDVCTEDYHLLKQLVLRRLEDFCSSASGLAHLPVNLWNVEVAN